MQRLHLFISGQVQGVYFRESARRQAADYNVMGWARNLPDGRVEIVAEGTEYAVGMLAKWCQTGPERARVRHVEVLSEPATGEFSSFEVVR